MNDMRKGYCRLSWDKTGQRSQLGDIAEIQIWDEVVASEMKKNGVDQSKYHRKVVVTHYGFRAKGKKEVEFSVSL
jgi:hypothetical protein